MKPVGSKTNMAEEARKVICTGPGPTDSGLGTVNGKPLLVTPTSPIARTTLSQGITAPPTPRLPWVADTPPDPPPPQEKETMYVPGGRVTRLGPLHLPNRRHRSG
jgi:hypothetical protein